jgi:putative intracellular protease/amidase
LVGQGGDAPVFHVGIVIGPGFIPMDMVGVQTVFAVVPGAQVHLLWKEDELVEGYPNWWTRPSTTFADCPERLDVLAVPMLAPEIQNDPELLAFVAEKARTARYIIGVCNGVLVLGAAGVLQGRRATSNHNAIPILEQLGVSEAVLSADGVVVDGNLSTSGPGVGSSETAFKVVEDAFGLMAAQFAEVALEYDPHPLYGMGNPATADPALVAQFEQMMQPLLAEYRKGSVDAFRGVPA